MLSTETAYLYIGVSTIVGLIYGVYLILMLTRVPVGETNDYHKNDPRYLKDIIGIKTETKERKNKTTGERELYEEELGPYHENWDQVVYTLVKISGAVSDGAIAFLREEYRILAIFIALFSLVIAVLVEEEIGQFWTVFAFVLGAATSILAGYIGMKVAVFANSRTAYSAINRENGLANAFKVAFRGGAVLGFVLTSLGLLNLAILI